VNDALRLVFWELTARCNLSCKHCRAEAQDHAVAGELSTEEILRVAADIRKAGDPILILTGGEPLVRKDIYDIASSCAKRFTRVALATNGTLIDGGIARKIAAHGIQRVSISIDGSCAATHDAFRGLPGSFDRALRGLQALRDAGLPVQINATVARHNLAEIGDILNLAISRGADAFHVFVLVPVGCGAEISDAARLSPAEMERALRWLFDKSLELRGRMHIKATCAPQYYRILREVSRERGIEMQRPVHGMHAMTRGCLAGSAVCFVSRTGDVQPCGYLPVRIGNVRETPFAEIWRQSEVFAALRSPASLKGKCGSCGYRVACAGCRARAYADTTDFLAEDPDCSYVPGPAHRALLPRGDAGEDPRGDGLCRAADAYAPPRHGRAPPGARDRPQTVGNGKATIMNGERGKAERTLRVALQRGIELVERPFAALGREVGMTEEAVVENVRGLFAEGLARRFGAVFDSRRLGYGSTLCAVDAPAHDLERAAAVLAPHPGVTHCYEREGHPNLWFTLTARVDRFRDELRALGSALAPYPVLDLPALRRFKVEVVLDAPACGPLAAPVRDAGESGVDVVAREFPERERAVIRKLQDNLPVTAAPFSAVAAELAWDPVELLRVLAAWKRDGVLRRVGIILRHRQAGFMANGMCVWRATPADVERAGPIVAGAAEVTHCYERPASGAFPYNLFAMVHARERPVAEALFRRLSEQAGLNDGLILMSVREFKKSSPVFFCEDGPAAGAAGA
jgi:heme b synthase